MKPGSCSTACSWEASTWWWPKFGLALDAVGGFAAPVWPPTGLALACLLRGRTSLWPGVLLGAFLANLWAGAPLTAALAIGVGNTLESVLAAIALRRAGFRSELERVRDVALITAAALTAPLVSAGVGVLTLRLSGMVPAPEAAVAFRAWWVGDVLGALVVAPLLLTFPRRRSLPAAQLGETLALTAFTALLTWFVFADRQGAGSAFQQPFLVFPALVWAALRLGQAVAVRATFLVSAAAIAATTFGRGPFASTALHEGLLALQVFMGVVSLGVLLLGAAVAERRRTQEALREAVALRDEFLSIAGHELRTPLAALSLDLGSLQRRLERAGANPAPEGGLEVINRRALRALKHAERLSRLVDRLLEVSQLRQGRLRLERQPHDLRTTVGEVVERFAEQAEQAGCQLKLEAGGEVTGFWDPLGSSRWPATSSAMPSNTEPASPSTSQSRGEATTACSPSATRGSAWPGRRSTASSIASPARCRAGTSGGSAWDSTSAAESSKPTVGPSSS